MAGRNLVIIGGGNGGPSTAFEAIRLDPGLNITIIESSEYVAAST
jgi:L-2-hydroxyglutarate oxidase LhgO